MVAEPDDEPPDGGDQPNDENELCTHWPKRTNQLFYRVDPRNVTELPRGILWHRVTGLAEIENLYDLGWKKNFEDVFWPKEL